MSSFEAKVEFPDDNEITKKEIAAMQIDHTKKNCKTCEMKDLCKFKDVISTIQTSIKNSIPKMKTVDDANFINKYLQISLDCQRWRSDDINRGKGII